MPLPKKIPKELASKSSCAGRVYANRYRVIKRLGSGSFGTVFLVEDLKGACERKVLKEISVGELKEDETFDAKREADLLSKLDHPNIVKFLDSFLEFESFCIVTEFCEGGDLTDKINARKKSGKQFDESLIVVWLIQLLLAIQFVHRKKILHRDLKTRNIFLKNNMIKIGDFGISRILMGTSDMATTFTGTPYYMSPEILKHEGYNSKSDIWALGVVLYELCTLDRAFEGQNLMGVMYKILEGKTPELPVKYHPELRALFNCMLSKNPAKRPSASEILTNHYISKKLEAMKSKMEQYSLNRSLDQGRNVKIREAYSRVREDSSFRTTRQRPMTPLEKMKLRKQEKADAEAEKVKQYTAAQFAENRQQYCHVKRKQSRITIGLPWVDEHPDVFNNVSHAISEQPTGSISPPLSPGTFIRRQPSQVQSSGDSGHVASDQEEDKDEKEKSETEDSLRTEELDELTLTNVSTIPEDGPEAETYYSQFDNEFEDLEEDVDDESKEDSLCSDEDYDNEYDALVDQMQMALELDTQETMVEEDELVGERFSQTMRQQRIKALKVECIKLLGEEDFKKVYHFLKEERFGEKKSTDEFITEGLRKIVDNPTDCFLVDQLLFLEKQVEISGSVW